MQEKLSVVVELYGIPRERAGMTEVMVASGSLGEVLDSLMEACPRLRDLRKGDGTISPHYRVSLDGARFLTDVAESVPEQSRLLLLSADVGG
jgi:hypothetical protein